MNAELKDKIDGMRDVYRLQVAHKLEDGEVLQRVISIHGSEETGYVASSEQWFVAQDKTLSEFYDVRFETTIYPTMTEALMDALPDTVKEARKDLYHLNVDIVDGTVVLLLGEGISIAQHPKVVEPEPRPEPQKPAINPADFEITDGYVGSLGKTYKPATETTLNEAIAAAATRNNTTYDAIVEKLLAGHSVEWCDSPNYYYDHGKGIIRRKKQVQPVKLVKCSCGHSVPQSQVMSASLGTSCPDCYDRMSG